jgi:hypothetical protein
MHDLSSERLTIEKLSWHLLMMKYLLINFLSGERRWLVYMMSVLCVMTVYQSRNFLFLWIQRQNITIWTLSKYNGIQWALSYPSPWHPFQFDSSIYTKVPKAVSLEVSLLKYCIHIEFMHEHMCLCVCYILKPSSLFHNHNSNRWEAQFMNLIMYFFHSCCLIFLVQILFLALCSQTHSITGLTIKS